MSLRSLKLLASLSFFACTTLFAAPLVIDVAGIQSNGALGDSANTVLLYNVGANATVTSVDYRVNLTAFRPSWLSEIGVAFTDSDGVEGVAFNPGFDDDGPGTLTYSGSANLADFALDFNVGADGILRLEFYEDFDDFAGADGTWNFGTLSFGIENGIQEVPEPMSALLLGAGAMAMGFGRRRAASKPAH